MLDNVVRSTVNNVTPNDDQTIRFLKAFINTVTQMEQDDDATVKIWKKDGDYILDYKDQVYKIPNIEITIGFLWGISVIDES